jgi:hypothetical protein
VSGIFYLNTAADLREKLRRDLAKMKAEPLNADAAFNFFVTAEHMLDWVYPKENDTQKKTDTRNQSVLLQVCSHLANGAKHFEATAKRHKSVSGTRVADGLFHLLGPRVRRQLTITLKGDAATQFGPTIEAIQLADMIMVYWDKHSLT